ncbi:5407_t:CDS:10, partial [Dentiscutata erythropus]
MNKIDVVTEKNEIINLAVKLIWNATEKSVSSVIFNGETATVLSQARSRSIIVDLDETDSVIIKGETYRKLNEKVNEDSEEASNIDNEKEIDHVSKVQKSTTKEIQDNDLKPSKVSIDDSQPFRNASTKINKFTAVKFTRNDSQALNNQQIESDNETSSQIDELEDEIMSNEKKNKQNSNSYRRRVLKRKAKNKGRRDKSKKKRIDVLSDIDEIMLDTFSPSTNEDEISYVSIPADQNDYPRVIIYLHEILNSDKGEQQHSPNDNENNQSIEKNDVNTLLERIVVDDEPRAERIEEIDKPLQNSKKKQIEDEMLNEEGFISDDDEVDNVSLLLNARLSINNKSNALTSPQEFSPSNDDNEQANNESSDQVYTLAGDQGSDE